MRFANTVQRWFNEKHGGGLLLPDGWHGRPYDNLHLLTSVEETDDTLTVILDQKLTLHFDDLKSVDARKAELIFAQFGKLRFDWEGYGKDAKRGTKEYLTGEAKIVCAPG